MLVLKALTVIVAGILTILALRHLMRQVEAAKVRVKVKAQNHRRTPTRLRQDPRTGIYYPDN
jgi:hypothetical protein